MVYNKLYSCRGDCVDKRIRITVNFRDNETDKKIYDYIQEQGEVIGISNAIKKIISDHMKQEGK